MDCRTGQADWAMSPTDPHHKSPELDLLAQHHTPRFFFLFIYFTLYVLMFCLYASMCTKCKPADPGTDIMDGIMWVLGTEPNSSTRATAEPTLYQSPTLLHVCSKLSPQTLHYKHL